MKSVLIVGATRNLGKELCNAYASQPNTIVYGTARFAKPVSTSPNVRYIGPIDITKPEAIATLAVRLINDFPIDIVYVVATSSHSLFSHETFDNLKFDHEMEMYKTSAIGPMFLVQHLVESNVLSKNAKIIFIGNEAGSIGLRTLGNRDGNYGYHGSLAALNMVTKLLSLDLASKGISVGVVHPGLVIPEEGSMGSFQGRKGGVKIEVAARSLMDFAEQFGMDKSGQFWATRGAEDIVAADAVLEPKTLQEIPLNLPW